MVGRYRAAGVGLVLGALLLAACGTPTNEVAVAVPDAEGVVGADEDVTLEFWTINLKEGYNEYIESSIDAYEEDNPGVTVKWLDIPDFQKTSSKLLAAISGGATPDVVNVTPFILPQFASSGSVYAIDEIADDVDAIEAEYLPGLWDAGVIDGRAYAIPFYGSVSALIYNRDLFEQAGLDPNAPPKTWDEVFEYAQIIHDKTGASGFVQTLDNFNDAGNPVDIVACQAGVPLLNADGTEAVFDTPEAAAMLDRYIQGVEEGWISQTSVSGEVLDGATELAQEKTAMVFLGPWILRWLSDNAEPEVFEKFAVAHHPQNAGGAANAFLQNFAIPKASEHPEQALDFARYFSGTTVELAKQAPVLPPLEELLEDPYFESSDEARVLVEQESKFYWPKHPKVLELLDAMRMEFQKALLGQASAEEALGRAADSWNTILQAG